MSGCKVTQTTLDRDVTAVVLENDVISATVLPSKGADIYEFISKPDDVDVLWKSPWGLRPPEASTRQSTRVPPGWRPTRGLAGDLPERRYG